MVSDEEVWALYEWVLKVDRKLSALKNEFPEWAKVDRNRLIASVSCLRVTLEIRLTASSRQRNPAPPKSGVAPGP